MTLKTPSINPLLSSSQTPESGSSSSNWGTEALALHGKSNLTATNRTSPADDNDDDASEVSNFSYDGGVDEGPPEVPVKPKAAKKKKKGQHSKKIKDKPTNTVISKNQPPQSTETEVTTNRVKKTGAYGKTRKKSLTKKIPLADTSEKSQQSSVAAAAANGGILLVDSSEFNASKANAGFTMDQYVSESMTEGDTTDQDVSKSRRRVRTRRKKSNTSTTVAKFNNSSSSKNNFNETADVQNEVFNASKIKAGATMEEYFSASMTEGETDTSKRRRPNSTTSKHPPNPSRTSSKEADQRKLKDSSMKDQSMKDQSITIDQLRRDNDLYGLERSSSSLEKDESLDKAKHNPDSPLKRPNLSVEAYSQSASAGLYRGRGMSPESKQRAAAIRRNTMSTSILESNNDSGLKKHRIPRRLKSHDPSAEKHNHSSGKTPFPRRSKSDDAATGGGQRSSTRPRSRSKSQSRRQMSVNEAARDRSRSRSKSKSRPPSADARNRSKRPPSKSRKPGSTPTQQQRKAMKDRSRSRSKSKTRRTTSRQGHQSQLAQGANDNIAGNKIKKERSQSLNLGVEEPKRPKRKGKIPDPFKKNSGGTSKANISHLNESLATFDQSLYSTQSMPVHSNSTSDADTTTYDYQPAHTHPSILGPSKRSQSVDATTKDRKLKETKRIGSKESPVLPTGESRKTNGTEAASKKPSHGSKIDPRTLECLLMDTADTTESSFLDEDDTIHSMAEDAFGAGNSIMTGHIAKDSAGRNNLPHRPTSSAKRNEKLTSPFSERTLQEPSLYGDTDETTVASTAAPTVSSNSSKNSRGSAEGKGLAATNEQPKRTSMTGINTAIGTYFDREESAQDVFKNGSVRTSRESVSMASSAGGSLLSDYSKNSGDSQGRKKKKGLGSPFSTDDSLDAINEASFVDAGMAISPFSTRAGLESSHSKDTLEVTERTNATPLIPNSDDEKEDDDDEDMASSFHNDTSAPPKKSKTKKKSPPTTRAAPKKKAVDSKKQSVKSKTASSKAAAAAVAVVATAKSTPTKEATAVSTPKKGAATSSGAVVTINTVTKKSTISKTNAPVIKPPMTTATISTKQSSSTATKAPANSKKPEFEEFEDPVPRKRPEQRKSAWWEVLCCKGRSSSEAVE